MSSVVATQRTRGSRRIPQLYGGDRLTQAEFHRRYVAGPADMRFELIEGMVVMASPVGHDHARYHARLAQVVGVFETATDGIKLAIDGTVLLARDGRRLSQTMAEGVQSREYAEFQSRLRTARKGH